MTPIVDIIKDITDAMKPTLDATSVVMARGGGVEYISATLSALRKLFVGEKIKLTFTEGVYYSYITAIDFDNLKFTIDLTEDGFAASPTAISVVINYHHGHPLEIINILKSKGQNESYGREVFPVICLFQDIPEKHMTGDFRTAKLNMVIATDTKREFEASERYTYTFKPVLIPLYEKMIDQMICSGDLEITSDAYDYFEHLFWGKNGLYGNSANIFNDFVDAIEIDNVNIKILKTN